MIKLSRVGGTSYEQAQSAELSLKITGGVALLSTTSLDSAAVWLIYHVERLFIWKTYEYI